MEIEHMQSDVIIMAAFTRLFFKNIYTYDNVAPVLFFLERIKQEVNRDRDGKRG